MPKISKEQAKNISGYGKQIKHLEFAKAVRKTPGQYIGYIGDLGHINMNREIIQNSIDEQEKEDSPCNWFRVEYYESTHTTIVKDNGRGIPHGFMFNIYTNSNTSSNYDKKPREFSAGRHGVGAKATMALSSEFFATSYICAEANNGKAVAHRIEFREGDVWKESDFNLPNGDPSFEKILPNKDNYQGSIVEFRPSYEIMGEISTTCEDIMKLISLMLPLMKIGSVIDFYGVKANGEIIDKHVKNEDGVLTFLICDSITPLISPILIEDICDDKKIDIAFTYDINDIGAESIQSFANICPTLNTANSTHVQGFLDGLTQYFRKYMNNIFLGKNSKLQIVSQDIRSGLHAVVSAKHLYPNFSGQAKEIFSNKDIIPFIKNAMNKQIDEWVKNNANDVQKLMHYFKDVAEERIKGEKNKANFVVKHRSAIDNLPEKCVKASGDEKDGLEFIIVEGDSALGSARLARDPKRQWLLPIRGKIINAMKKPKSVYFLNEEAKAIRNILGSGEGSSFDITQCKFSKIIFLGDADVDGKHIRQLLLKTFLIYYRPLIEAGRVYAAQPPLYGAKINGKRVYFTDTKAYIDYSLKDFCKQNEVLSVSEKPLPKEVLKHLLYINSSYFDELTSVSTTFAVNPYLLEYVLMIKDEKFETISKKIKKFSRFLDVEKINGSIVITGLTDNKINTLIVNEFLLSNCAHIERYLDNCPEKYFIVNGVKVTLAGLMKIYEKFQPSGISRYKGLGEMNPNELKISTLHPDYDRHLERFRTDDIKKEIQAIREVEFNKSLLLKGVDFAGYEL